MSRRGDPTDDCAGEVTGGRASALAYVEGERHQRKLLDPHPGRDRDRRQLGEFHGAFTNDVAAEDGIGGPQVTLTDRLMDDHQALRRGHDIDHPCGRKAVVTCFE
jgi:hypothetical protein